ncbi:MAG: biotin--[acetyl-CoA-carboxylase] ligase [Oscillospiraceae bacterium]|nr:biotin--[acetyl-CoA-carboxylase] ligase [Oscillospiraceae bacterium]
MKNTILDILKNAGDYISGEEISRILGISRAAVWKHIRNLKNDGYEIDSVTNKGYRLVNAPDIISIDTLNSLLTTKYTARNTKYFPQTDSTNEAAKRDSSSPDGSLYIAGIQTAGKGRLGRGWESPEGAGIWMSLLLKPDIAPQDISEITLIAGIAVCRAAGKGAEIKWPNDIVIGSRKICGILTEMSAEIERVNHIVCGIGINVNTPSFPPELQNKATSLLIETGEKTSRTELIAGVMNEFEPLYETFIKSGFKAVRDEYRRLCVTLGKDVQVIYRKETITGKAIDIDDNGRLIVDTNNGRITVTSGEVSVRGLYGYI